MKLNPNRIALIAVSTLLMGSGNSATTLTEQLKEKIKAASIKGTPEKRKIMEDAIAALRKTHIIEQALKVGDKMPDFSLPDVNGSTVQSKALLKKGPLVVVFYRGAWCPYCNLQLRDVQEHFQEIQTLGADLVAISPQTPDNSLTMTQKVSLKFHVLSDAGNKVAKGFGIVYKIPTDLKKLYLEFGVDLQKSNGTQDWELPLGATYIVRTDGKISYAFLDADYKKRAETLDVLKRLKEISK